MNEQFTQTLIQTERFLKKFKFIIIFIIIVALAYVGFDKFTKYTREQNLIASNEIYLNLITANDQNTEQIAASEQKLKSLSPNLYSMYLFYTKHDVDGAISATDDTILKNIYKTSSPSGKYLKDLTSLKQAYELLKQDQIKQANEVLNDITADSMFFTIAKNLKHYQGK